MSFKKDPACFYLAEGWVEVDRENRKARRGRPQSRAWTTEFAKSDVYKKAMDKGWLPHIEPCANPYGDKFIWYDIEYVDFVTRVNEWCSTQIIDAFKMLGDLQLLLVENGYYMRFPHLGNVVFNPSPMMVDIGDIYDINVRPDVVVVQGKVGEYSIENRIANWPEIKKLLEAACTMPMPTGVQAARDAYYKMKSKDRPGGWSTYRTIPLPANNDFSTNAAHHKAKGVSFFNVLNKRRPRTLIDFGCHTGYYSLMADSLGIKCLGMDITEDAIATAHKVAGERGASCSFVAVNLMDLPPAIGPQGTGGHITARIKAEAGIAPALIHHLSQRGFSFEAQAALFNKFVKGWFAVEFIPREDIYVSGWNMPAWYTRANYVKAFKKYWPKVTIMPSFPEPRCVLVFDR